MHAQVRSPLPQGPAQPSGIPPTPHTGVSLFPTDSIICAAKESRLQRACAEQRPDKVTQPDADDRVAISREPVTPEQVDVHDTLHQDWQAPSLAATRSIPA